MIITGTIFTLELQRMHTYDKSNTTLNDLFQISGYFAVLACMCSGMAFGDNGNGVVVTARSSDDCQVTPVIHVLQYPGCVPKPIPSFACTGRCSSYLQVN